MFGFTPQLGVVNGIRIPTATPISHIYPRFTAEKKQWVSNNLQGSWAPRFTEEKKQ